jgi:Arc/MetJ-type ribon-helix-helix transcriptional regulator
MNIDLRPEHQQLIAKALDSGEFRSPQEVIEHALELYESQEKWLLENRDAIDEKILRGIEQLDRGEGVPEKELDAHLDRLKAK